jgi:predicted SAM-dependent methyltransferase
MKSATSHLNSLLDAYLDEPGRLDLEDHWHALSESQRDALIRRWRKVSKAKLRSLFGGAQHIQRKLNIGAGNTKLPGWVNTDLLPHGPCIYYLNAQEKFPFEDGQVQYIYSEHMIEHITLEDGQRMLTECFRVLAPKGKIRIATPDLPKILSLYGTVDQTTRRYKDWALRYNNLRHGPDEDCLLINNFMRAWGHRFIYDEPTLRYCLAAANFDNIERCAVGFSSDPSLCGLEHHGYSIGHEWNEFETMVLEAQRTR